MSHVSESVYYPLRGSVLWALLSTGGACLTASLTRGYQSVTPVGVTVTYRVDVSLRLLTPADIFGVAAMLHALTGVSASV